MIENSLQNIRGVEIFPVIALIMFVAFFAALAVWVSRTDKNHMFIMSSMPLDADKELNSNGENYDK